MQVTIQTLPQSSDLFAVKDNNSFTCTRAIYSLITEAYSLSHLYLCLRDSIKEFQIVTFNYCIGTRSLANADYHFAGEGRSLH